MITKFVNRAAVKLLAAMAMCLIAPVRGAEQPSSDPKDKDAEKVQTNGADELGKIWLRLVKVDIAKDSPLRDDATFNDPPYVYVTFKPKEDKPHSTSSYNGWSVAFPDDLKKNQLLVTTDKESEYTFEVWDSQYQRNKMLFSVGPMAGASLQEMLRSVDAKDTSKPKQLTLEDKEAKATMTLAYAGTRVWYGLRNITIPPESSHRNALTAPPRLYLVLKIEGIPIGDRSGIVEGWSTDFPNKLENCWPVREGGTARYSLEVWNARGLDSLLFTVTGLSGIDFRSVITEPIDKLIGKAAATKIEFGRCESEPR